MRRALAILGGLAIASACSGAPDEPDETDDSTAGPGDSDSGPATIYCSAACAGETPWPATDPLVIRYNGSTRDHRSRVTADGSSDAPWSEDGTTGSSDQPPVVDQLTLPNPGVGTWMVEFQIRKNLGWEKFFPCVPNRGDVCPNVPTPPPAGYDPERHVVFVVEDVDTDTDDTDGS